VYAVEDLPLESEHALADIIRESTITVILASQHGPGGPFFKRV